MKVYGFTAFVLYLVPFLVNVCLSPLAYKLGGGYFSSTL